MSRSVDRKTYLRLIVLAGELHDEALVCAEHDAFRAGCWLLGAALEGLLLATALALEPDLRAKGKWPKGDPLKWPLGTLLKLAHDAGWFPESSPETPGKFVPLAEVELGDAAKWLQWLRNLVHPGLFVRDMPENVELNETAFQNAYQVLDSAFAVAFAVLQRSEWLDDVP